MCFYTLLEALWQNQSVASKCTSFLSQQLYFSVVILQKLEIAIIKMLSITLIIFKISKQSQKTIIGDCLIHIQDGEQTQSLKMVDRIFKDTKKWLTADLKNSSGSFTWLNTFTWFKNLNNMYTLIILPILHSTDNRSFLPKGSNTVMHLWILSTMITFLRVKF